MDFGDAFKAVKNGAGMRLPKWSEDVVIRMHEPLDAKEKMTERYLYVESRYGFVPWIPTQIELFSNNWEVLLSP